MKFGHTRRPNVTYIRMFQLTSSVKQKAAYRTGAAIADPPDVLEIVKYDFFEMREGYNEIRMSPGSKKVAVIELVSHANKEVARGAGYTLKSKKSC